MKFLIGYFSQSSVEDRDEQIAISQGCHGDITKYWFSVIKHPTRDEWGMVIPDSEQDKITSEEISSLKSKEHMDADGWFPNPFPPQ